MRKLIFIVVPAFFLIGFLGYAYLGGFKEIEVTTAEDIQYLIAGNEYKGNLKDDSLKTIYNSISAVVLEGKVKGTFCALQYIEPDNNDGNVHSLIGIIVKDSLQALPGNLKYHTVNFQKLVRARITTHYAVAPRPKTVNQKMKEFAHAKNLSLDSITLEKYIGAREMEVEVKAR